MAHRILVVPTIPDSRAHALLKEITENYPIDQVTVANSYALDTEIPNFHAVAQMLSSPAMHETFIDTLPTLDFDWAIEIGFKPGVTDNVANTAREGIVALLSHSLDDTEGAYTSQLIFLKGNLCEAHVQSIADQRYNPLIESAQIRSKAQILSEGFTPAIPRVNLQHQPSVSIVDILTADDNELKRIGKFGIVDHNRELTQEEFDQKFMRYGESTDPNTILKLGDLFSQDGNYFEKVRRGPLALDLNYMNTIVSYFRVKGRNPTDLELESLAQTWSEHCKHTIFAEDMDMQSENPVEGGLYKRFIKAATKEIRKKKGAKDFCVSVFTDNSGIIKFDEHHYVSHKAETHNSPSALDPFGGAITGIVGVNRDALGAGMGLEPIINIYGFCFGDPFDTRPLYKGENKTQLMLSPRRIAEGVIKGVNVGGNCSGIPSPQGFAIFDESYRGKPLVFVGTVGLVPTVSAGKPSYEKGANPGDYIIMLGGKVGKDGIHGATFSSEAIDASSPATAVQIGDPITQKKMSDALMEIRDRGLYSDITDNGAGGLSCSVAEMAKSTGGCEVDLSSVPLKYQGLDPWEIWISEAQERMTLAVPAEHLDSFLTHMKNRDVEATVLGKFTDSGSCVVHYNKKKVMDIDMDFLHDGLPPRPLTTTYTTKQFLEPNFPMDQNQTFTFLSMLGQQNIASLQFISEQYDHEVKGGSVLKPLQGPGKVNAETTVTRPVLDSQKALVLSQGIIPFYSEIDSYAMAACAIDTAVRNAVAAGASLEHLALLDNFCWCDSNNKERLGQLKSAVQACYDTAVVYETPFISGKDSMFNDFKGFDEQGEPTLISILPTLLVSSIGVMEDARKAVSIDAKSEGDFVYVLGDTHDELGGSEYFAMKGKEERGEKYVGNQVPQVDTEHNLLVYKALQKAIEKEMIESSISVGRGGLAIALAKTAMAGNMGMDIFMNQVSGDYTREDFGLYSESQGRIVVTVAPENAQAFELQMQDVSCSSIGRTNDDKQFIIHGKTDHALVDATIDTMKTTYKKTFEGF